MLRNEQVSIVKYISETVRAAAGGSIPRGVCYTDSPHLFARYRHGDHIGDALGIRIFLNTAFADGWVKFYDSYGTEICFGIAFTV